MARSIGLDRGITLNLISLGDMEFRRKRPDAAVALYEQARQRAAAAEVQHALALSLLRLARVNRSQQRVALASAETDQSLVIAREIGAPGLEAEALYSRAELARLQKHFDQALENYQAADSAEARIGDPDLLWQIQLGRARAQEASGNVSAAVASLEAAVKLIEGVRGRLQEPRFRSGYVEDKFEVYLELMRLQLQQGRTADAFSTAERLRARSFVEQLGGRASVPLSASDRRTEAGAARTRPPAAAVPRGHGRRRGTRVPRASDESLFAGTAARREGVPDLSRRSRPRPRSRPARCPTRRASSVASRPTRRCSSTSSDPKAWSCSCSPRAAWR